VKRFFRECPFGIQAVMCALFASLVACVVGCTTARQTVHEERRETNGVVTVRDASATARVLGDAEQALAKLRLSVGKTLSIGLEGVDQSASSSNTVQALEKLDSILGRVLK
jgi:hypothetical protein